jgi:hypothetical protein
MVYKEERGKIGKKKGLSKECVAPTNRGHNDALNCTTKKAFWTLEGAVDGAHAPPTSYPKGTNAPHVLCLTISSITLSLIYFSY